MIGHIARKQSWIDARGLSLTERMGRSSVRSETG